MIRSTAQFHSGRNVTGNIWAAPLYGTDMSSTTNYKLTTLMSFLEDCNTTYGSQLLCCPIPWRLDVRIIGVSESAVAAEALLEEFEETIRMAFAYTSLHEDLGKLEVLARVEKGAPWLVIDRGEIGRSLYMAMVRQRLSFLRSPAIWVVYNSEINCWADSRASRLI